MKTKVAPIVKPLPVHIRWCIRRDMPEVLAIENVNFEFPWSEDDFIRCLRQRNCIAQVAEHGEKIVGYTIYELHKGRLHILDIAVHAACHRKGVAAAMIRKLIGKLSAGVGRRNRIMCEVRESNLDAQLFFKACGFRAISVIRDFYTEHTAEDAYLFCYKFEAAHAATRPVHDSDFDAAERMHGEDQ